MGPWLAQVQALCFLGKGNKQQTNQKDPSGRGYAGSHVVVVSNKEAHNKRTRRSQETSSSGSKRETGAAQSRWIQLGQPQCEDRKVAVGSDTHQGKRGYKQPQRI